MQFGNKMYSGGFRDILVWAKKNKNKNKENYFGQGQNYVTLFWR